jgi:hypothetical protein
MVKNHLRSRSGRVSSWTRMIPGIAGEVAAIEKSGEAAVLQLHDLKGDIIATAALSEMETKLLSTYNPTEFGVPQPGTQVPKYSWLGATGVASELSTTGVSTQGGSSYVPLIARSLQTQIVVPPGAAPNGSGGGTPASDAEAPWLIAGAEASGAEAPGREAQRQEEARRKAEEEAERARNNLPGGAPAPGEEEGEDPSIIVGKNTASFLAGVFRHTDEASEVLSKAKGPLGRLANIIAFGLELFGGELANELATGLENCVNRINNTSSERAFEGCKLFAELFYHGLPLAWGVETCFGDKQHPDAYCDPNSLTDKERY